MCLKQFAVTFSQQRWLPYKTRRSVLKRIHPGMLKDFPFETDFFGGYGLRFRGNIVNYIDRLIYFCGAHEKYMLAMLRDYTSRLKQQQTGYPLTFVDVGANAGNHTLFMAKLAERVYAFEPYPRVREQLEGHLALNRLHNVTVYPVGLSDQEAVQPFYAAPDSNLGAASFWQDHKADNHYLGDMRLRRGDDVVAETGMRIDILKADVEGYEPFVLRGLKQTIERDRPLMVIELSPKTRETLGSATAFQELFPARYRFFYFASGSNDSGAYHLMPYDYSMTPKIQDVIACPEEKLAALAA